MQRFHELEVDGEVLRVPVIGGGAFEVLEASLPAQAAAGATAVTELGAVPSTFAEPVWVPSKVSLTSPTLVTGQATNFVTYNFRYWRAGVLQGTFATLAMLATVLLSVETEATLVITAGSQFNAGDVLDVQMVQTGTGLASPVGIIAKVELQ